MKKRKPRYIETDPYQFRNKTLKQLGFMSYSEYLGSNFWKGVRDFFLKHHCECVACGSQATQVHHVSYSRKNLSGVNHEGMYSLCRPCHERIEFSDSGGKVNLEQANKRLVEICCQAGKAVPEIASQPSHLHEKDVSKFRGDKPTGIAIAMQCTGCGRGAVEIGDSPRPCRCGGRLIPKWKNRQSKKTKRHRVVR